MNSSLIIFNTVGKNTKSNRSYINKKISIHKINMMRKDLKYLDGKLATLSKNVYRSEHLKKNTQQKQYVDYAELCNYVVPSLMLM